MKKSIIAGLKGASIIAFAAAIALATPVASTAAILTVAPQGGLGAMYTSIQEAVDAAESGDTVQLFEGVYEEQVVVDGKSLSISGEGQTKTLIKAPETFAEPGGKQAIVSVFGDCRVDIERLGIEGPFLVEWIDPEDEEHEDGPTATAVVGVLAQNSTNGFQKVTLEDVRVRNIFNATEIGESFDERIPGAAVEALGGGGDAGSALEMRKVSLGSYENFGLYASGQGRDIIVSDSLLEGTPGYDLDTGFGNGDMIPPIGIWLGGGASLEIKDSTIVDHSFEGEEGSGFGVLVAEAPAGDLVIEGCTIEDNDVGISIAAADDGRIAGNNIDGNGGGVILGREDHGSNDDVVLEILDNQISRSGNSGGLILYYVPSIDALKVRFNLFAENDGLNVKVVGGQETGLDLAYNYWDTPDASDSSFEDKMVWPNQYGILYDPWADKPDPFVMSGVGFSTEGKWFSQRDIEAGGVILAGSDATGVSVEVNTEDVTAPFSLVIGFFDKNPVAAAIPAPEIEDEETLDPEIQAQAETTLFPARSSFVGAFYRDVKFVGENLPERAILKFYYAGQVNPDEEIYKLFRYDEAEDAWIEVGLLENVPGTVRIGGKGYAFSGYFGFELSEENGLAPSDLAGTALAAAILEDPDGSGGGGGKPGDVWEEAGGCNSFGPGASVLWGAFLMAAAGIVCRKRG